MSDISYDDAISALLASVPEIQSFCQSEAVRLQLDVLRYPHIIYGSVFADFIRKIEPDSYAADSKFTLILIDCFELIERLANSSDFETRCIVEASILESLLGNDDQDWKRFSKFFGPKTKEMALKLAERWEIRIE